MPLSERLSTWAAHTGSIPNVQNGFRPSARTVDNLFVLRCAIDQARANKSPLYVAFIDLSNAFPSTVREALWMKLWNWGVRGPIFDWIRLVYDRMLYFARLGDATSDLFSSSRGILQGDPLSPLLFVLFLSDLHLPTLPGDISLGSLELNYIAQADDIVAFSAAVRAFQAHLAALDGWGLLNFQSINVDKSYWTPFAAVPMPYPPFSLNGKPLPLSLEAVYLGALLTSDGPDLLAPHAEAQALKARGISGRIFSLENDIGTVDVKNGLLFYKALTDPYLSYACEVSPDASDALLKPLRLAQHRFLRRLLGVNMFGPVCLLFSETGLWPLFWRRLELCLRYLQFLLSLSPDRPAFQALQSSITLFRCHPRRRGWFRDLVFVCSRAGLTIPLDADELSVEHIELVRGSIRPAMRRSLHTQATALTKIGLMKAFLDAETLKTSPRATSHDFSPRLRSYLLIPNPAHRIALTKLLFSSHSLAVEELRYAIRGHGRVPWERRLCRFCHSALEDEAHALLGCMADNDLCVLRGAYLREVYALFPHLLAPAARASLPHLLDSLLRCAPLLPRTAAYVHSVLRRFKQCTLYIDPTLHNVP